MLICGDILDGRYEVIDVLGHGGMSTVYLCKNTRLGNLWAVKEVTKDKLKLEDLSKEPEILKRLNHPGIPKIIDIFYRDENLYIVEEYIKGDTLESCVKKSNRFTEEAVIKTTLKLCDIVDYLHSLDPPVIYRDLKPSNIMVTPEDAVYLIDFGISRTYKQGCQGDTTLLGTKGYAAPEQYGTSQSCKQTDIYGLGATMFYMALGKVPSSAIEALSDAIYQDVSRGLKVIIKKALQVDAKDRFQDIREMKGELYSLLNGQNEAEGVVKDKPSLNIEETKILDKPDITKAFTSVKKKKDISFKKIAAVVVALTIILLLGQYYLIGNKKTPLALGARENEKASVVGNQEAQRTESKPQQPVSTKENKEVVSEIVKAEPVEEIFVQGVVDTKMPIVLDKQNGKGKSKNKHEEKYNNVYYKLNPQAASGRFENKFIARITYIQCSEGDVGMYLSIDNNTDKDLCIQAKDTYLTGNRGRNNRADESDNITIPSGVKGQDVKITFKDFGFSTGTVSLRSRITSKDLTYNKEIVLTINVK